MADPEKVVVVGASGFGRECLDVLDAMATNGGALEILGVVDDRPSQANLERLGARSVAYLGTLGDWLTAVPSDVKYVLGIGDPRVKRRLAERFSAAGLSAFTAVHPNVTIGESSVLQEGVVVCAGSAISTNCRLGRHVHVNPNATIGHDTVLQEFVSVNPAAVVSGEVRIQPGVLVGAGAIILQNLYIGDGTTIGAGAVVTKDVPPAATVVGIPGRWGSGRNAADDRHGNLPLTERGESM